MKGCAVMPSTKPSRNQLAIGFAVALALAIVGGLVWGFGRQLALARQMREEEVRLEQAVATEETRNKTLAARLKYVKSDEYVERWAREEAGMSKPGEVVIVPLANADDVGDDVGDNVGDKEPTDDTQPEQTSPSASRPFWVELWELIFGPADR